MSAPAVAELRIALVRQNVENLEEESIAGQQARVATQYDIARLAYALWERRGSPDGSAEFDWLEAEKQLGDFAAMNWSASRNLA
jgi:hypothetical protein